MKRRSKLALALVIMGMALASHAQNLVQSLTVNLTAYDAVNNREVRIGTSQLIRYLVGSNLVSGRLYLVTPIGNAPGATGNLNAFLRISQGATTVLEIPSPGEFNLYQDYAALRTAGAHSLNRFSIDSGSVQAELQGISTWSISHRMVGGVDVSGTGVFRSTVNGWISIFNATQDRAPVKGTIAAGSPRPGP